VEKSRITFTAALQFLTLIVDVTKIFVKLKKKYFESGENDDKEIFTHLKNCLSVRAW